MKTATKRSGGQPSRPTQSVHGSGAAHDSQDACLAISTDLEARSHAWCEATPGPEDTRRLRAPEHP